ncbi:MAG: beta-galactosidase [Eubacterium sp.]|nr:beta-galactosidase [Eubacterium sp.]
MTVKTNGTLFGAAYYLEYMPYDRIDTDFKLMKAAGMNVIRIAESTWSTWEPQDNIFDFTLLHRMLDKAVEYGLNVIVGTPTYAIPAWLIKKHPDIICQTIDDHPIYGHRQIHDITNTDFLYHADRIITKVVQEVRDYPNVIGYQIDNETRSGDAASPRVQKLFLEDLKNKYPDIEEFNKEFGLDYWSNRIDSWLDMPDIRGTINGSLSAAFKAWHRERISKYQMWQRSIIKANARPDQFITHNYDYSWKGYSFGIQPLVNQRQAAEAVDIPGVDIYHKTQDMFEGDTIAFGGAIGRSLKKSSYLVLETQSQGRLDWTPYPGQLRQAYYSHLSSGASSLMYWNWHSIHNSFESYWRGILSHDLEPNSTYQELAETRKEGLKIDSLICNLKKECKVAILADNRSLTGLDEFPISDISDTEYKPKDNWNNPAERPESLDYNTILRWVYDTLYKMNIEADIIYAQDINLLDSNELKNKYPMLIVPALYSASQETIIRLKEYVLKGGHLIATFKSFYSDQELKIYNDLQPHGMTDIFGVKYQQFTRPDGVKVIFKESETDLEKKNIHTAHWMEMLMPDKDEYIWATYDHKYWGKYSAVIHKNMDKTPDNTLPGSATYIGCFMEKTGLEYIFKKVAQIAKINIPEQHFPVIIKEGKNELGKHISYYFNYSDKPVEISYSGSFGKELLSDKSIKTGEKLMIPDWGLKIIMTD